MVVVVALAALLRRTWPVAALHSVPLVVYTAWLAAPLAREVRDRRVGARGRRLVPLRRRPAVRGVGVRDRRGLVDRGDARGLLCSLSGGKIATLFDNYGY